MSKDRYKTQKAKIMHRTQLLLEATAVANNMEK